MSEEKEVVIREMASALIDGHATEPCLLLGKVNAVRQILESIMGLDEYGIDVCVVLTKPTNTLADQT